MCESERLTHIFKDKWDLHSLNGTVSDAMRASAKIAEFAISSISTMACKNPSIQVAGLVPYLGTCLEVNWNYAIPICAIIVVVQLILYSYLFLLS